MEFSVMFWGDALETGSTTQTYYNGLIQLAQYADEHGFAAVWLPERHFHRWGGQHPNPSVLAAVLATATRRVKLRAGSVVLPLHNPLRVVEDWAVVDNLSGGRVELSVATGWKDDDFVIAPQKYANRHTDVWEMIRTVQRLWRGERYVGENGNGTSIEVLTYPRPVQSEIPIWITSSHSVETMSKAGTGGYGMLTHLLGQDLDGLATKLEAYRAHRRRAGFESTGRVAVMVHTFLGNDRGVVKETVRAALTSYLMNSADLMVPRHKRAEWDQTDPGTKEQLMEIAFDRYFQTSSLLGTPASCKGVVERLETMGVTDVCCLIDFGLPADVVLEGMTYLTQLREACSVVPRDRAR